jgi:catechol 2,3-dioxygenase-like lactoylglutathione lyase family enzyme
MSRAFKGIDHAVVATRDLDKAADTWRRLGFCLTPRSRHPALGSENHCIIMHGDYIELLSPGDHPGTRYFAEFADARSGMAALALRSEDIEATKAILTRSRIGVGETLTFTRPAVMPEGSVMTAEFSVTMIDQDLTPGGMLFGCQHHTPQHIWVTGYEKHPNSAERISAVIYAAAETGKAARQFERILDSVGRGGPQGSIEVATGDAPIFVLPTAGFGARYKEAAEGIVAPGFAGLSIQVIDIQQTADWLTSQGVPFSGSASLHLLVAPEHANGVMLEFYRAGDALSLAKAG